jgi:hypothetical protein
MKVYNRFLTGIAALALVFSGLSGCETPTGDPGPRGTDIPHYLSIESATTVVAPGGPDIANQFRAIFKGNDVSYNVQTRWEVSGDGAYNNWDGWTPPKPWTGPNDPVDGHHPGTYITADNTGPAVLTVHEDEQATVLQITASHGGYSASVQLSIGARGLDFIRLLPGTKDGYTKIDLYRGEPANPSTVMTQPKFGFYFVYTKTETEVKNVLKDQTLETTKTVNEDEEIMVKNGDWITVYEVPQDELYNTSVNGYVSLQVHSSASEIYKGYSEKKLEDTNGQHNELPHNVLVPNLYEPQEFSSLSANSRNSVLENSDGGGTTGTEVTVTQLLPAYPVVFEGKYNAWAFDELTYEAMNKDAPLVTAGAVPINGLTVTLPTVGRWQLVVQHKDSEAWWPIDIGDILHRQYSKASPKTIQENILMINLSGGKQLTQYNGISVNGIPFSGTPLDFTPTYVRLYLGDLDLTAPAAIPDANPQNQFVAGTGAGVMVSIPADHFAKGTAPVTMSDPDVQVTWAVDADVRGRIITSGVKLKAGDRSVVRVVNPFNGAQITGNYNFQWSFVNGVQWDPVAQKTVVEDPVGQWLNTYQGDSTDVGNYLGLKVTGQIGFIVHGPKEFVFGVITE